MHDHLQALWYSPDLQRRMCYYCAETCTDNGYDLVGGVRKQTLDPRPWTLDPGP